MFDSISIVGTFSALLLPWAVGSVWVFWLLRRTPRWNGFVVAGHGYLVGMLITTLLIRVWGLTSLPLNYWGIASIAALLAIMGLLALKLGEAPLKKPQLQQPLLKWQLAVTALLLVLIAARYLNLAQELMLRPLFPWDAWMNWAPKAVVWFHYKALVPFVSPGDWLQLSAEMRGYTEGAGGAWKYPVMVPLIQLWGMLGMGTSDHTLAYLPWLLAVLALGLALYGHLKLAGASTPIAVLACYVLLNLPFLNVHVALAGYADIWVAVAFGCAVFALHECKASGQWPYAVLALILALMCTQLKIPGIIMGGIVLAVLLLTLIKFTTKSAIALTAAALLTVLFIGFVGVDLDIPWFGRVILNAREISIPYIGAYTLQYHPVSHALINTVYLMINWNMLGYLMLLIVPLLIIRPSLLRATFIELTATILTLAFIILVYFFSERYRYAEDYTQVNRALLYSIPVIVFLVFNALLSLRQPRYMAPVKKAQQDSSEVGA